MKIGYARVSTPDQNPALQLEALEKAGCEKIYQEKKSAFKERPELIRALEDLRTGDILYVWSLDRLGRSMKEIRTNVDLIMNKGAHLVDEVSKVHAICVKCGQLASFSHRTVKNEKQVLLGETAEYEPLCRECYLRARGEDEQKV